MHISQMNKKDQKDITYMCLIIYNKSELLSVFILYCLFYNAPQFYPNLL